MLPSESVTQDKDEEQHPELQCQIQFPDIINDKINTEEFLTASRDVVRIVEKFGKVFAPVKYDMQGNIDKLTSTYNTDKKNNATLQDMILLERATNESIVATDALMWLRRALHLILLFFEEILKDYKAGKATEDLMMFLRRSYQQALEPYHGWMAQQLFGLLSRMVPTRSQLLNALANGAENMDDVVLKNMDVYLISLRRNVEALEVFYQNNNFEDTNVV